MKKLQIGVVYNPQHTFIMGPIARELSSCDSLRVSEFGGCVSLLEESLCSFDCVLSHVSLGAPFSFDAVTKVVSSLPETYFYFLDIHYLLRETALAERENVVLLDRKEGREFYVSPVTYFEATMAK